MFSIHFQVCCIQRPRYPVFSGLLHQAIMLSGSSTAGWATHRFGQPAWSVSNIAAYIQCEKESDKHTIHSFFKSFGLIASSSTECDIQEKIPDCISVS